MKLKIVGGPWDGKFIHLPDRNCEIKVNEGGLMDLPEPTIYIVREMLFDGDTISFVAPMDMSLVEAIHRMLEEYNGLL